MVSLFDLLPFYVGAACLGVAWGMRLFDGNVWRWPAMVLAGLAGWFFCRLLLQGISKFLDFRYQKKLRSLTVDEITRQIGDPATPAWSLALFELKTRGEDLTEIRLRLIDLLCDESGPCRLFASRALATVFPEDIEKLNGYSPYDPPETCRAKTAILKTNPMNERQIEATGEKELGPCDCCGGMSRTVWGYVNRDTVMEAAYFVQWTAGHVQEHGANFDLIIGPWGEDASREDRVSVSMAFRWTPAGPQFMVIDSSTRPVAASELAGRPLARHDVIGTPLTQQVFDIVDCVWLNDQRIEEITRKPSIDS